MKLQYIRGQDKDGLVHCVRLTSISGVGALECQVALAVRMVDAAPDWASHDLPQLMKTDANVDCLRCIALEEP